MKLFIANCTSQHHDFIYRVPESNRTTMQQIPAGGCVEIWKDDSRMVLEAILQPHLKYGIVPVDEIDRTKDFIGMAYSFDRPVQASSIMRAATHNQDVLKERGAEQRKQAAVAIHNALADSAKNENAEVAEFDATVQQVDSPTPEVNETVQVTTRRGRPRKE